MSTIERRLAALETARGVRWRERGAFVIFDAGTAEVHTDIPPYKPYERQRHSDETPDDFQRRVLVEAREYGPKPISMTRQRYQEICAKLETEI